MKVSLAEYKKLGKIGNVIYRITCPRSQSGSGKVGYIGKSIGGSRLRDYITGRCASQPKLYNSIKKYGVQEHEIQILHEAPTAEGLIGLQTLCIAMYGTFTHGLNCTHGGDGVTTYSTSFCAEIVKMNKNGETFSSIGRKLGIHASTVIKLIERIGHTPSNNYQISINVCNLCWELNCEGKSFSQISRYLNPDKKPDTNLIKQLIIRTGNTPIDNFYSSKEDCEKCWALNKQGNTFSEIAKVIDSDVSNVIRMIKRSGNMPINQAKVRRTERSISILTNAKQLVDSGMSFESVAKSIGMKPKHLSQMAKNNNFQL